MRKIGIDLDGTITPYGLNNQRFKFPWWSWAFLIPLILLIRPRREVVEKMRLMEKQGYEFTIITSRPRQFTRFTRWLLRRYRVPCHTLFCVGFEKGINERKLLLLRKENISIYVERNKNIVRFLRENGIEAIGSLYDIEEIPHSD